MLVYEVMIAESTREIATGGAFWRRSAHFWPALAFGTFFGLADRQYELYTGNQNYYYLHGLARAGRGLLATDWIASTVDPTPAFTAFVQFIAAYHLDFLFMVGYVLMRAVCGLAFFAIAAYISPHLCSRRMWPVFGLLLTAWYSPSLWLRAIPGFVRTYLDPLIARSQDGVAMQSLRHPFLEPSTFGILLVVSIALCLADRVALAGLATALSITLHPGGALAGAMITLGLGVALAVERRFRQCLILCLTTGLLSAPALAYLLLNFGSDHSAVGEAAVRILANRIPHHAIPAVWFGKGAAFQLAIIFAGISAVWTVKRLRNSLVVVTFLGLALTFVQVATGSLRLGVIFPWRVSVVLVPICTVVLLVRAFDLLPGVNDPPEPANNGKWRRLRLGALVMSCVLALAGLGGTVYDAHRPDKDIGDIAKYVLQHHKPGDQVLTDPDTERFRIESETPAFVDTRSVPFRAAELIEWAHRIDLADTFYHAPDLQARQQLRTIASTYGINFVLLPRDRFALAGDNPPVIANAGFGLWRTEDLIKAAPVSAGNLN